MPTVCLPCSHDTGLSFEFPISKQSFISNKLIININFNEISFCSLILHLFKHLELTEFFKFFGRQLDGLATIWRFQDYLFLFHFKRESLILDVFLLDLFDLSSLFLRLLPDIHANVASAFFFLLRFDFSRLELYNLRLGIG